MEEWEVSSKRGGGRTERPLRVVVVGCDRGRGGCMMGGSMMGGGMGARGAIGGAFHLMISPMVFLLRFMVHTIGGRFYEKGRSWWEGRSNGHE